MEAQYRLFEGSKEEEDEMQPDVVWEGIAKLFDYQQLASAWPSSTGSEGNGGALLDWLDSSDEGSPLPLRCGNRPRTSADDESRSSTWNNIVDDRTRPLLHKTISTSSTDSSVPGELELKRQRRKQQNRKAQQAYRARQEGRMKQLEDALSTATLQLKQYEQMIEQLRISLQHPRQLGRSNSR